VISQGTTGGQRYVIATLGTLAEAVEQAAIPTPALVIVGDVVTVRGEFTTVATAALPTGSRLPGHAAPGRAAIYRSSAA
jgi:siroheme synthase